MTLTFLRSSNFLVNAVYLASYIHFISGLDEFEIGQDSDRNYVMAAEIADYWPLFFFSGPMHNTWKTGPVS